MNNVNDAGSNQEDSRDKIIKKPVPDITLLNFEGAENSLDDFDHLRITAEKNIPKTVPTITWDDAAIAAPGNITGISAAAKAGKSAFVSSIIAGVLNETAYSDFKSLGIKPNANGFAIIVMDTEQSEDDQQSIIKSILKRRGAISTPINLLAYNIRQLGIHEYKSVTAGICDAAIEEFEGIDLIVIDGGADYIKSVNDEESAYEIVQYFTHLAIKYSCPIIVVVHQNPGSDKERGHFGSQIQRKCYGLVSISKEGGVSKAEAKMMRKGDIDAMIPIYFAYSHEHGYHVEVSPPDKDKAYQDKNYNKMVELASEVFSSGRYKYSEAVNLIMKHRIIGERTAKTYIKNMTAWYIISKDEKDCYGFKNS